jgi:hypothetical protein
MKTALLVVVWGGLLLAAGAVALHLWLELDDVSLGLHGWLALGLGVGVSLILGVGLMMLVFRSARRGYDDDVAGGRDDAGLRRDDDAQR